MPCHKDVPKNVNGIMAGRSETEVDNCVYFLKVITRSPKLLHDEIRKQTMWCKDQLKTNSSSILSKMLMNNSFAHFTILIVLAEFSNYVEEYNL